MARRGKPEEERAREWLVFRWWVPSEGFEWIDGERVAGVGKSGDSGPWLVARGELGEEYRPLHDPRRVLFRDLADVTDRHTALAFANRYGQLGVFEPILRGAGATTGRGLNGESLARWIREAAHLRAAVQLTEAAMARNTQRLEKWIEAHSRAAVFSHPDCGTVTVRAAEPAFQLLGPKLPGLGLLFAQRLVNAKLQNYGGEEGAWAMPRVLADADRPGALVLGITPLHLLAAAWVQLARSLTGESTTRFRRCLGCDKWLAIGPGVGREDRSFCGDTCRKRVKRAQQRQRARKGKS